MQFEAAFAIPGDLQTRTGGYIYERRMLETLNEIGQPTRHVALQASWPEPTPEAERDLITRLGALPERMPLILDGLVFGSMDTEILACQTRPVIAMLHHPLGLEAGLPPARAKALLIREADNLRHAAHVVVPSPHTREILMASFGVPSDRISIALPGFDRPPARPAAAKPMPPLILSVGIICKRKGHDVLLDALGRIRQLDWQAVIVGMVHEKSVQEELRAQCAALELETRVRFAGVIAQTDLDQLYRDATLFALATRYEGYGMVLSEAQLHGLPIVSCAVGAVPQTVTAQSAILTPAEDPDAFAAALSHVLQDKIERENMARESSRSGALLPQWGDAAKVMKAALDKVMTGP